MAKENILVFGASQHARCTLDILEQVGDYNIVGLVDREKSNGEHVERYDVLGKIEDLISICQRYNAFKGIVAIGDNYSRYRVSLEILKLVPNFTFVSAIHPSVYKGKNVSIGPGSLIKAGVTIDNDTKIGKHCYLDINVAFGHDSTLGDYSSFGPGAITGGNAKIGECSFIGLGAQILHGRSVGNDTVIGAAALVNKDVGHNLVAYGVPAKEVRGRTKEEKYL